jgi:hypothetical protein
MKDYRLRIGMRFVQQGREFIIEGPPPDNQLKIKDTFTDVCSARATAGLLEDLFAGRLELIGAGSEDQVLRDALAQIQQVRSSEYCLHPSIFSYPSTLTNLPTEPKS